MRRAGQYKLAVLIARYGRDGKLFTWTDEITAPRKLARNESDPCGAICPDLAKVLRWYRKSREFYQITLNPSLPLGQSGEDVYR